MKRVIPYGHELLRKYITKDDITVDMTAGNGHDTLFLSTISRKVIAFDIQIQAIANTKVLLENNNVDNVELINDSHEFVDKYIKDNIGGAIFNLGYLPGSDKTITTQYDKTIIGIKKIINLLKVSGICIIVVYPGHPEGYIESIYIEELLKELPQEYFSVLKYSFINQVNNPPYLLAILKRK